MSERLTCLGHLGGDTVWVPHALFAAQQHTLVDQLIGRKYPKTRHQRAPWHSHAHRSDHQPFKTRDLAWIFTQQLGLKSLPLRQPAECATI